MELNVPYDARMVWLRFGLMWLYYELLLDLCDVAGAVLQWTCVLREILGKYLQVRRTSYFWAFRSFQMFRGPLSQRKLHL